MLHDEYPSWEFISFTNEEDEASKALLRKLGYEEFGYIESKNSVVFGKWLTNDTKLKIREKIKKS